MKIKNAFRNLMYAGLTALQLSCSSGSWYTGGSSGSDSHGNLPLKENQYYNIESFEAINQKSNLKVSLKTKGNKYGLYWKKDYKEFESFISEDNHPTGIEMRIELNEPLKNFVRINPLNILRTDEMGRVEFLITPISKDYILTNLNPKDGSITNYNKNKTVTDEEIMGSLEIILPNSPFYRPKPGYPLLWYPSNLSSKRKDEEEREHRAKLEEYKNFDALKRQFEGKHREFVLYGVPSKELITKRNKRLREEKRAEENRIAQIELIEKTKRNNEEYAKIREKASLILRFSYREV